MEHDFAVLAGAPARGLVSAAAVALLLVAERRWGRGAAGLLAGLPTVTAPALVWLALDHGPVFAAGAARGAVAAGAACALFALAWSRASRRQPPAACLGWATLATVPALGLAVLDRPAPALLLAVLGVVAGCTVLQRAEPVRGGAASGPPPRAVVARPARAEGPRSAGSGALLPAGVAGAVSALASLAAQPLGPQVAGWLASPPLLAAVLAWLLQSRSGDATAREFLRGYTLGLAGRSVFVALFGTLLQPLGLAGALLLSLALTAVVGGAAACRRAARVSSSTRGRLSERPGRRASRRSNRPPALRARCLRAPERSADERGRAATVTARQRGAAVAGPSRRAPP